MDQVPKNRRTKSRIECSTTIVLRMYSNLGLEEQRDLPWSWPQLNVALLEAWESNKAA